MRYKKSFQDLLSNLVPLLSSAPVEEYFLQSESLQALYYITDLEYAIEYGVMDLVAMQMIIQNKWQTHSILNS